VKKLVYILLLLSLASCSFFKKKKDTGNDIIARVNDEYLYASDLQSLTKGLKGKDSTDVLKNYSENWVRKKLLLQKAQENIADGDISITKKVEDYRETLLLYEYEKALINQKLDTTVKEAELNEWYEKVKGDFLLEKDVYLVLFIKLKKDAPDLDQARKWIIKPKDDEDRLKTEGYCREYASSYQTENGMWYDHDNLLKNFPLNESDINSLSSSKNYREFKTDEGSWFIKIADVMKKDSYSPLEFIRDQLVKAIIEKRRVQLVERVYAKIYQDGIKSKSFEVLVK
jgi:hypothetical protein